MWQIDAGTGRTHCDFHERRYQNDAIQGQLMFVQQVVRHPTRSHAAIAFAEDILRRRPAAVLGYVLHDEFGYRLDVLIHTPEVLAFALAHRLCETGTYRIDHDEIGFIDNAVLVLHSFEGSVRTKSCIGHDGTLRTEDTHVQPYRCGSRAAVVGKHDRSTGFIG